MDDTILNIEKNIKEANSHIWQPTPVIRWKKINENEKNYNNFSKVITVNKNGVMFQKKIKKEI